MRDVSATRASRAAASSCASSSADGPRAPRTWRRRRPGAAHRARSAAPRHRQRAEPLAVVHAYSAAQGAARALRRARARRALAGRASSDAFATAGSRPRHVYRPGHPDRRDDRRRLLRRSVRRAPRLDARRLRRPPGRREHRTLTRAVRAWRISRSRPSSYGVRRSRASTARCSLAGNVIWSSDLIETATTSSSTEDAGKGGGGDSQTLNDDLQLQRPSARSAFAPGRSPASARSGPTASSSITASDARRRHGARLAIARRRHPHLPRRRDADRRPLIEAAEGAGNVPGYRGLAYVVFEDFQLAEFGNRMPLFEFEPIASGDRGAARAALDRSRRPPAADAGVQRGHLYAWHALADRRERTFRRQRLRHRGHAARLADQSTRGGRAARRSSRRQLARARLSRERHRAAFWNVETDETVEAVWMARLFRAAPEAARTMPSSSTRSRPRTRCARQAAAHLPSGGAVLGGTSVPHNYPEKVIDLWVSAQ
jgi:hypothetical protein